MRAKALLAVAAGVLLSLPTAAETTPATPTVDEIIAKHIEALGGKEKIDAVQTAKVTGTMSFGPMKFPFTMDWKKPDHMRLEFEVQGTKGTQAFDGTTAWAHMPFRGKAEPEKMSEEDTAKVAQQADMFAGPLVDYQQKGHAVELVGKKDVEGTEAYDLEITLKNKDVMHLFLDAETYLPIKEEIKTTQNGAEVEVESSISNYKEVGGLMIPFNRESRPKGAPAGGQGQTLVVENIELGVAIDDSRFAFPEAPAAAPAPTKPPGS